jgi:hypothetical protein
MFKGAILLSRQKLELIISGEKEGKLPLVALCPPFLQRLGPDEKGLAMRGPKSHLQNNQASHAEDSKSSFGGLQHDTVFTSLYQATPTPLK